MAVGLIGMVVGRGGAQSSICDVCRTVGWRKGWRSPAGPISVALLTAPCRWCLYTAWLSQAWLGAVATQPLLGWWSSVVILPRRGCCRVSGKVQGILHQLG